jgi:hypothetical protein
MNAPAKLQQFKPAPSPQRRSIDARYQQYEVLKRQLTAGARTSEEYDAAVREAARLAGV